MVRANFKQNSLLESLDNLFENGGNIYIKPPFNKYYRVSDPAEIADLEGMDQYEFESFEAEDPVREYINVVGYAIAKDQYRDQIEEASGLIYAEIGEDGKLYYNVGERVFEVETDDIGINYDEMGREVESEVVKSPSKGSKKTLKESTGPDISMDEAEPEIVTVVTDTLTYEVGPANLFANHFSYYDMEAPESVKNKLSRYGNDIIKFEFYMGHYPECFESHNYHIETASKDEYRDLLTKADVPGRGGKEFGEQLKQRILSKLGEGENLKENDEFDKLVDDIYEFFSEWDPYSVDKADYDLDRDSIKLALSTPDKDDKVLYDIKEIRDELEDGDPLKDKANSIIDRLTFTEEQDLNEIGPVAAGLIGAAGGALVGSLATKALSKNESDTLDDKDNEPAKYKVSFYPYDRYGSDEGLKNASFSAKTLKDALKKLADRLGLYLEPEDIDEEYSDAREALESIKDSNGDGCDYIVLFKNETTGEVYIEEDYKPEDLDWDDDYDESEKPKKVKKSLKELDSKDNTSTIYIDLSEIISYAEKYISKELRMAGGSDCKITTTEDGQYMITLNRGDNSIKAYCDLGSENADEALGENEKLKESDSRAKAIVDNVYDILSDHSEDWMFDEGVNMSLTDDGKIYLEPNGFDEMYVLTVREDNRSRERKFATDNQDELEDEYRGIYGSDWSHWDEFIDSKMGK